MELTTEDIKLIKDKAMVIYAWEHLRENHTDPEELRIIDLMRDSAIESLEMYHRDINWVKGK